MTKTNAVIFDVAKGNVEVGPVEVPELGSTDVLVQAGIVGLCRSDNELLEGHLSGQLDLPKRVIPGHEWAGTVLETGRSVTNISVGDRVVGECIIADGDWFGFTYDGAAAEKFKVPAKLLHRIPEGIDLAQAALIEPFTIAYHAFVQSGKCDAADIVTVIGGGMVGLCASSIAKARGAFVVLVEPNSKRRELATELGADIAINPAEIGDITDFYSQFGRSGANLVVEASGHPNGIASTFRHVANRGQITNIGICSADVTAPLGLLQAKNLTVRGVTGSTGVWADAIRFMQRSAIDLTPVVSSIFDYRDADQAMRVTNDPESIKVHLTFG